jgi:hypothetical protein
VYAFVLCNGVEDGVAEFGLMPGAPGALGDDEWTAAWDGTWAGERASQPLLNIKPVATAAAATERMEREDGEFMPSPTNPIP